MKSLLSRGILLIALMLAFSLTFAQENQTSTDQHSPDSEMQQEEHPDAGSMHHETDADYVPDQPETNSGNAALEDNAVADHDIPQDESDQGRTTTKRPAHIQRPDAGDVADHDIPKDELDQGRTTTERPAHIQPNAGDVAEHDVPDPELQSSMEKETPQVEHRFVDEDGAQEGAYTPPTHDYPQNDLNGEQPEQYSPPDHEYPQEDIDDIK